MSDLGGSLHCRSLSLFLLQVVISIHYLATSRCWLFSGCDWCVGVCICV